MEYTGSYHEAIHWPFAALKQRLAEISIAMCTPMDADEREEFDTEMDCITFEMHERDAEVLRFIVALGKIRNLQELEQL
jgi:hypothetical protein